MMIKNILFSGLVFILLFFNDFTVQSKIKNIYLSYEQTIVLKADVVNFLKILSGKNDDVKFNMILEEIELESDTAQQVIIFSLKTKLNNQGLSLSDYFEDIGFNEDDIGYKLIEITDHAIENSILTIIKRLKQSGFLNPTVYKTGSMRISIELPGEIQEEITTMVQTTGKLTFNLCKNNEFSKNLLQDIDKALFIFEPSSGTQQISKYFDAKFSKSLNALIAYEEDISKIVNIFESEEVKAIIPNDITIYRANKEIVGMDNKRYKELHVVKKKPELTEQVITNATLELDKDSEMPLVSIEMNSIGAEKWTRITGENIDKKCAIVFDGIVYSTPVIKDKIIGGKTNIQGFATFKEAKIISILLNSGALEIPLKIIE